MPKWFVIAIATTVIMGNGVCHAADQRTYSGGRKHEDTAPVAARKGHSEKGIKRGATTASEAQRACAPYPDCLVNDFSSTGPVKKPAKRMHKPFAVTKELAPSTPLRRTVKSQPAATSGKGHNEKGI